MPKLSKTKQRKTGNPTMIEEGTGNVFLDLGFPKDEAVNLLARSVLSYQIEEIIKERGWTQEQAARFLGVKQPRVSDLINRRIEKFTVDMLMKWLSKLGKEVTISVKDRDAA